MKSVRTSKLMQFVAPNTSSKLDSIQLTSRKALNFSAPKIIGDGLIQWKSLLTVWLDEFTVSVDFRNHG